MVVAVSYDEVVLEKLPAVDKLRELGMEHLKAECTRRGLKCGGDEPSDACVALICDTCGRHARDEGREAVGSARQERGGHRSQVACKEEMSTAYPAVGGGAQWRLHWLCCLLCFFLTTSH